jgi:hypothetical protein
MVGTFLRSSVKTTWTENCCTLAMTVHPYVAINSWSLLTLYLWPSILSSSLSESNILKPLVNLKSIQWYLKQTCTGLLIIQITDPNKSTIATSGGRHFWNCMCVCSLTAGERTYRFAPNLACLFLETRRYFRKVKTTKKLSWVRNPVTVVSVSKQARN